MNSNTKINLAPEGLNIDTGSAVAAPLPEKPKRVAKPSDKHGWWWGTGRRKTAIARVRVKPSQDGKVLICKDGDVTKTVEEYFSEDRDRKAVMQALILCGIVGKMDVRMRLNGGGYMGQAGAALLGISRALSDMDPNFDEILRKAGMMTRDSRKVERKKYGQAGARRRFQFSKR